MKSPIDATEKEVDARALVRAIIMAQKKTKDPGAEKWCNNTVHFRPLMVAAVKEEWCKITGLQYHQFPFSHDYIADRWVKNRKETKQKKQEVLRYVMGGKFEL